MGINVTSDEKGNYYLDQKKLIESAVCQCNISLPGTGSCYSIRISKS